MDDERDGTQAVEMMEVEREVSGGMRLTP